MCIAVNEKGKCSEYFILNIEGMYKTMLFYLYIYYIYILLLYSQS